MNQESNHQSRADKWLREFVKNPSDALDQLLTGRYYMGALEPNDTDEILFRLFNSQPKEMLKKLDKTMQEWLTFHWGTVPGEILAGRWARILQNVFIAVYRLDLRQSARFLGAIYIEDKYWIRSLYMGPSRDPEGELLRTLALMQEDRTRLPLWMGLCRLEEEHPVHHTAVGLLGLRFLPEKDGKPQTDLPGAFFKGAVNLAEALGKRNNKEYMDFWLREIRAVTALYPRSKGYWAQYFSPFLFREPDGIAARWINKAIPKLMPYHSPKKRVYMEPPPKEQNTHFLKLIKEKPLEQFREDLEVFLARHRNYAMQTGDSFFLVKTFSNIGYRIYRQDPIFSLELVEEAFAWEPYNPVLWTNRAIIENFRGNTRRAEVLLWEARRRFPGNPKIRNKLAHILERQGKHDVAELLYRQAIRDFPRDVVCRTGLGEVLKAQNRLEEAEAVYRETMKEFPRNAVCRTGLGEVLKAQNRLEEAEAVYRETMKEFPRNAVCRNGLAVVLLKQEKIEEALTILRETVKKFPNNKVANDLLERLTGDKPVTVADNIEQAIEADTHQFPSFDDEEQENNVYFSLPEHGQWTEPESTPKFESTMTQAPDKSGASLISSPKPKYGTASPVPAEIEAQLGELTLKFMEFRRTAKENDKEKNQHTLSNLSKFIEKLHSEAPGHLPLLMLKSLLALEERNDETFAARQSQAHPNTLGFKLLEIRNLSAAGNEIDDTRWNRLNHDFPYRSTIINLERTLNRTNIQTETSENLQNDIERLRKLISKDSRRLPLSLQGNEEWINQTIRHSIFGKINIEEDITPITLEAITENLKNKDTGMQLRDTIDQYFCAEI